MRLVHFQLVSEVWYHSRQAGLGGVERRTCERVRPLRSQIDNASLQVHVNSAAIPDHIGDHRSDLKGLETWNVKHAHVERTRMT